MRIFTLILLCLPHFSFAQIAIEYSIPGNYTWIKPVNLDSIIVECWGGGGGGGIAYLVNQGGTRRGGGGGGGSYSKSILSSLQGESFNISIGNGGNGNIFTQNSGPGGPTIFGNNLVYASGGSGGSAGSDLDQFGNGGNGGNALLNIGSYFYPGGNGLDGLNFCGGGGGGSAECNQPGAHSSSCDGAISLSCGGNGGNGGNEIQNQGIDGNIPGGGGGGGYLNCTCANLPVTAFGGNGGNGKMLITYIGVYGIGKLFNDVNQDCTIQQNETGIRGINYYVSPIGFVGVTDSLGNYYLPQLPIGSYSITIDTCNLNWISNCQINQAFYVNDPNNIINAPNFGLLSSNPCADLDVSIYAPILRPCLPNQMIYVSACNQTTATGSLNASYVDVELDPLMSVTGSSLPYTSQGNNLYRFQTGDLYPGQCANFNIATTISSPTIGCAGLLGLTLCMDANLYPIQSCALDTIPSDPIVNDGTGGTLNGFPQPCTLPWDQSSLSVDGWCQGDSVYFSITNTGEPGGGDMECYSPMWVTVDGVVTYTDSIMIPGGETVILSYFGNGQTWILNAEQHPLHPGNSHPNAHVEACGDTANWTPDIVNDFPQDDADPVVDIYCGVVTGSYDPNDKTGYPIGQTDQKYIQPNQQLQYVIRFQNTGTDTAFTVVIRDTLDTDLNIFTLTSGVSSHQYDFRMYGPRVLEWTFNNINLPDSTTNQEGSNGFVTFHVDQVPNLAPGTEITNDADIYFDFNDPITTNTTIHRIYGGFVSVLNVEELTQNGKSLLVYPNPTSHSITIKGEKNMNQAFSIFDQMGREVFKGKLNGITTEVNLSILSKGIYTLKIEGNYKPAQIVKE